MLHKKINLLFISLILMIKTIIPSNTRTYHPRAIPLTDYLIAEPIILSILTNPHEDNFIKALITTTSQTLVLSDAEAAPLAIVSRNFAEPHPVSEFNGSVFHSMQNYNIYSLNDQIVQLAIKNPDVSQNTSTISEICHCHKEGLITWERKFVYGSYHKEPLRIKITEKK